MQFDTGNRMPFPFPDTGIAAFRPSARARKSILFLFLVTAALVGSGKKALGQSVIDGFDPRANAPVHVVVVQPDGKVLLGGEFTTLAPNGGLPVTRNHIARLNSNGTLDAFNPNSNANVYAIAVQTDGKIIVGGHFSGASSVGGQTRNYIESGIRRHRL